MLIAFGTQASCLVNQGLGVGPLSFGQGAWDADALFPCFACDLQEVLRTLEISVRLIYPRVYPKTHHEVLRSGDRSDLRFLDISARLPTS